VKTGALIRAGWRFVRNLLSPRRSPSERLEQAKADAEAEAKARVKPAP
jgi:hypothetical protein